MLEIVSPVFENLAHGDLKKNMRFSGDGNRRNFCMLEAFGRSFCGFSPFLNERKCEDEEMQTVLEYRTLLTRCLDHATDPSSPDYMNFGSEYGAQPLVDAAFLAQGIIRSGTFAATLPETLKKQIIRALSRTREIIPYSNNWILFSGMIEAGIYTLGGECDTTRVIYGVRQFMRWYVGDGIYGDGDFFHMDYYNSFVIQPMLVDIARIFGDIIPEIGKARPEIIRRAARYCEILERFINRDGTYPYIGRSIAYRFGAFQLLAQAVSENFLPTGLSPAAVRCALTAVIKRTMKSNIFDAEGWLKIGVYGQQPSLGENYICTGSLYLCTAVFLPLGLPDNAPFWSSPDEKWTSLRITDGEDVAKDVFI